MNASTITADHTHNAGLRLIATFELLKGVLVLIVGFALFHYIDRDLEALARDLLRHLRMNPASTMARIIIASAARVPESQMIYLSLGAGVYAVVRFIEAFGLWHNRAWAEWFALISCAIYVPIELFELIRGVSLLKICFLVINIIVVIYLSYALYDQNRSRRMKMPLATP